MNTKQEYDERRRRERARDALAAETDEAMLDILRAFRNFANGTAILNVGGSLVSFRNLARPAIAEDDHE